MIWLTVCGDTFGRNRVGLAGNNYNLSDLNCLSLSETDGVYSVAYPCVGGRIIIRTARCRMRHSIINVPKHGFDCLTLGVYAFGGVREILPLPGPGLGCTFQLWAADLR